MHRVNAPRATGEELQEQCLVATAGLLKGVESLDETIGRCSRCLKAHSFRLTLSEIHSLRRRWPALLPAHPRGSTSFLLLNPEETSFYFMGV